MLNKKACREFAAPGVAMSMDSGILQAEQVKYIIQTAVRIIDHKKTLVLYIHDREHAAQGGFPACLDHVSLQRRLYYSDPAGGRQDLLANGVL